MSARYGFRFLRAAATAFVGLVALAAPGRAQEAFNREQVLAKAASDPDYWRRLVNDPRATIPTQANVRVIVEPPGSRVLVLPPLRKDAGSSSPPRDAAEQLELRLATDTAFRARIKSDWKSAFTNAGLTTPPAGDLIVVEPQGSEQVLVLPFRSPSSAGSSPMVTSIADGAEASQTSGSDQLCKYPPCGKPPGNNPPKEFITTILRIDQKHWNQNPFGPGCKNNDRAMFKIPNGATLHSITMGEHDCGTTGPDTQVGIYTDTHVALGIVAGGTVLNSRPPQGATGNQELSFHWWFNQWGHSQAFICVNVKSKKPISVDVSKVDRYDHVNMDAGWVKHRIKSPVCFKEFNVAVDLQGPIDGRPVSYKDIHIGGQVAHSDNCVIEWFGCRDDSNTIP